VGTRDGANPNKFYALDASNLGQEVWNQPGGGFGSMGIISGQALVDYANQRVYFTSYAFGAAPDDRTVWCLGLPAGNVLWAQPYGNLPTAPTGRGNRLYIGTADGKVKALDTADGSTVWTFDTGTGQPVKGYVVADRLSNDLYFSTTNEVWAIRDLGGTAGPKWTVAYPDGHVYLAGASTPVFLPGGGSVYVGSADGSLHRLDAATGAEAPGVPTTFPLQLGDGGGVVGSPTIDSRDGFLYVGTDAGVVYAVKLIP